MLADDAGFARHRLIAFDFSLPTRIASLEGRESARLPRGCSCWQVARRDAPGSVAQFGKIRSTQLFSPQRLATPRLLVHGIHDDPGSRAQAYLVLSRLSLPSQDLVDVGARRRVLQESRRRMRLLRFGLVVLHVWSVGKGSVFGRLR